MQFSDVIGQSSVKEHLVQMVSNNRLSHALLFLGKEGVGALPLAIAFAQYVVCEKVNGKQSSGPSLLGTESPGPITQFHTDSCGTCPSCIKARQLVHPDIHFTYPVITKKPGEKPISTDFISEWRHFISENPYRNLYDWLQFIHAENKQGNITAAECNDIIRKLNLKSFESEYKILIIWMPELMGKEGNKLLKLIEEPPPKTLFIFVAENESLVLPTILSRTQLIKIAPLTNQEVESALELKAGAKMERARQVSLISEGNYREALMLIQNAEEDWHSQLREWLNALLKNGPAAQVKWIDEISKQGREKQKQFIKYFIQLLEHAIKLRAIGKEDNQVFDNETDFAIRLNKICNISQQDAIIKELDKASYYIERNANAKMLFHALSIKLSYIIKNNSLILMN